MAEKNNTDVRERLYRFGIMFFLVLSFFVIVLALKTVKEYSYIGYDPAYKNTIVVSGEGEAFAVPDIAVFSFSVTEDGKTVPEAQGKATSQMNAALAVLHDEGIADKDIRTTGYYVNPKYEYPNVKPLVCTDQYCPPPPSTNPVLIGYTVNHSIEVKIRESEKAGDIVAKVGAAGISNVSGVEFTVDDPTKVEEEARQKAIADAEEKAIQEAHDLGVRLVGVVTFSENSGPMYYKTGLMAADSSMGSGMMPPSVPLPQGENKVTSNVQITYEIR